MKSFTNVLIYILIIGTLIGREYFISSGFSWGDISSLLLFLLILFRSGFKGICSDLISKYSIGYLVILLLSSFLNLSIAETSFLNYFRILFEGYIVYVAVINTIRNKESLKIFSKFLIVYIVYFLVRARSILNASFVSMSFEEMSFGRTNWGFTNLLLIIFIILLLHYKYFNRYILYGMCLLLSYNILFSVSRFAIFGLMIFFVLYRFWINRKITLRELGLYISLAIIIPLFLRFMNTTVDSSILQGSREYLQYKMSLTQDEALNVRVMMLNIQPIENFIAEADLLRFLFGTGNTITHGIISQTFIASGFIGFFYFFYTQFRIILYYLKQKRIGVFVVLVLCIMLVNDINTNCRFEVARNTIIYMLLLGFLNVLMQISSKQKTVK